MKNTFKYSLLAMLLAATVTTGCRKDDTEPDVVDAHDNHTSSGLITMMVHHKVGTENFAYNTDFTDDFGNVYQFTRAQFYMSGAQLLDMNSAPAHTFSETYHVISPDAMLYDLGTVEQGHFHSILFDVGVDSATNHMDPTLYDASNPLAIQSPSMHWGWNPGYKFIVLEGLVDTDGDNIPETNMTYHVGTDGLLMATDVVDIHTELMHDVSALTLHMEIDYAQFLSGINLALETNTHTADNLPLATTIANNASGILSKQN